MTFSLECRACGHSNRVDSSLVGKRVKCRGCGVALLVSPPSKSAGAPSRPAARLKFNCPACGKEFATRPELAGKELRCSGCQKVILVPAGAAAPAERPPRGPARTHGESAMGETPGGEEVWHSFPRVRTHGESAKAETSPRPTSQPDRDRNPDRATPVPSPLDLEHSNYQVSTQPGDLGVTAYKGADEPDEKVESGLPPRMQLEEQGRQKAAAKADEDPALTRARRGQETQTQDETQGLLRPQRDFETLRRHPGARARGVVCGLGLSLLPVAFWAHAGELGICNLLHGHCIAAGTRRR